MQLKWLNYGLCKLFLPLCFTFLSLAHAQTCDHHLQVGLFSAKNFIQTHPSIENSEVLNLKTKDFNQQVGFNKSVANGGVINDLRRQAAKEVQDELHKIPMAKNIRHVFYLASGYDASTPFMIFPEATTVINVDQHPFVADKKVSLVIKDPKDFNSDYTHFSEADNNKSFASAMLFRLKADILNFRLRKITIYSELKQRHHGVIEFDTGENTTVRTLIHLDSNVGVEGEPKPWWLDGLLSYGVDAFLVKGSLGAYQIEDLENPRTVSDYLLGSLLKRGGIIVDGDNKFWPWKWKNFSNVKVHRPYIRKFGYYAVQIYEIEKSVDNIPKN